MVWVKRLNRNHYWERPKRLNRCHLLSFLSSTPPFQKSSTPPSPFLIFFTHSRPQVLSISRYAFWSDVSLCIWTVCVFLFVWLDMFLFYHFSFLIMNVFWSQKLSWVINDFMTMWMWTHRKILIARMYIWWIRLGSLPHKARVWKHERAIS